MKLKITGSGDYILKENTLSSTKNNEFKIKIEGDTVVVSNKGGIDIFGNSNSNISISGTCNSNISISGSNITINGVLLDSLNKMSNIEDDEPGVKEYIFSEQITDINVSGSISLKLDDFNFLSSNLNCMVSGSSDLKINNYTSNILNCMVSGSSDLKINNCVIALCNINCSGSSGVKLNETTSIENMIANLNGASSIKKNGAIIKNLTSNCSGVSKIK